MKINHQLAAHTTQIAFHLTVTRTMIGAMQTIKYCQEMHRAGLYQRDTFMQGEVPPLRLYVTGSKSLQARGLVEDVPTPPGKHWAQQPTSQLTEAGERVWDLLVMAGVVQNFAIPANLKKHKKRVA